MSFVINGKLFKPETSGHLHGSGDGRALYADAGRLDVYRSPKGTVWARLYYWVSETRDVEDLAAGEREVHQLILRARRTSAVEEVFGPVEEG